MIGFLILMLVAIFVVIGIASFFKTAASVAADGTSTVAKIVKIDRRAAISNIIFETDSGERVGLSATPGVSKTWMEGDRGLLVYHKDSLKSFTPGSPIEGRNNANQN